MSEARHSPRRGERGERLLSYEKRNLENGDSTGDISSHRSSYNAWCDKLHVECARKSLSHPSMVFTPLSIPPFPGDRNPKREGLTNLLGGGAC